jgi:hypothetical protein
MFAFNGTLRVETEITLQMVDMACVKNNRLETIHV